MRRDLTQKWLIHKNPELGGVLVNIVIIMGIFLVCKITLKNQVMVASVFTQFV